MLSLFLLPIFISPGDSWCLQLYDYVSNRGAYPTEAQYFTGKHICKVWLTACALILMQLMYFFIFMHVCKYLYWPPSSRCPPYISSSRVKFELNLVKVTICLLIGDLLGIHSAVTICNMYTLIYTVFVSLLFVKSRYYNDAGPHTHRGAKDWTSGGPIVVCVMLCLRCMLYYVSIHTMESSFE